MKKTTALLLVGSLCLSLLTLAPTAAAHDCDVEYGNSMQAECEKPCTEGENHNHPVNHWHEPWFEDPYNHVHYDCSSRAPGQEPEEKCTYNRVEFPQIVCDILDKFDNPPSPPDPQQVASLAIGVAGGVAGTVTNNVNDDVVCPSLKTPEGAVKPDDPPQVPCCTCLPGLSSGSPRSFTRKSFSGA